MRLPRAPIGSTVLLAATLGYAAETRPPETPRRPVADAYHGAKVVDDYRWLENGSDAKVQAWSDAQNGYARSVLDRLPGVDGIRKRVSELRRLRVPRYSRLTFAGGTLFALKNEPPRQQAFLVTLPSEDVADAERVLVDPNVLDPRGGTSIDWYVVSPDGRRVAVSLSEGGSERGNLHFYEAASGKEFGEVVPRVNYGTAAGSAAWDAAGEGVFYSRYPREGERPAADMDFYTQVYYHRLGTPTDTDRYEIGREFPRIAEIFLDRSPDGRYVVANVANGDGGEFAQHLRSPDGRWTTLSGFSDKVVSAEFGPGEALYAVSKHGASRGKVLKLALTAATPGALAGASTFVPESEVVVRSVTAGEGILFVVDQVGGPEQVRLFDAAGKPLGKLPLSPVSSVGGLVPLRGTGRETVLYQSTSFVAPATWYRYEAAPASAAAGNAPPPKAAALSRPVPVSFEDVEVVREWAVSKDGTRVPMSLLHRKGLARDGTNPTVLTGYGGFDLSVSPSFDVGLRVWLDAGGVWAVANLRGGSEFGEAWHEAGKLTKKQNVFDDFVACAERLVTLGYTRKERLAIEGGSNGGLLMGAALTQRPDLFRAVVSHVGIYDMLRVELSPNGVFNVPEFGTVKDAGQFRALYAYSPYHHVKEGARYPDVLMLTGANDPRVDPMQSRKMTARLQAVTQGRSLVLLRTSANTGHGGGTPLDARIEQETDVWAFLFDRLGVKSATKEPNSSRTEY
jgi:prolyl oligopeptidase